jgi:hypothetical protein
MPAGTVPPPRTSGGADTNTAPLPTPNGGGTPGAGANGQSQTSIIPPGHDVAHGGRLSHDANGGLVFRANNVASNHFAIMKELGALNDTASAALLANKDNDAEVANIQLQMQRFTKILGIIEQNMASALQFGLSIIGIHDSIFQRPAFRPS